MNRSTKAGPVKPTKAELKAACGRRVPDVIAPGLKVLFVGINPGLYSGAVGHHFARPGNRFWPALSGAGFTAPGGGFPRSRSGTCCGKGTASRTS